MLRLRFVAPGLGLATLLAVFACGGEDDPAGAGSSGSPAADASASSSSSSGNAPRPDSGPGQPDGAPDAAPDAAVAGGFLYASGETASTTVHYYDLVAAAAVAASPAFDPDQWSAGLVVSESGEHFMYGDAAGSIFVGHAGVGGAATNVTGAPKSLGDDGRLNAILQEDGTLVYAGEYAEAGMIDVFRNQTRVSTGDGRRDAADVAEATTAVYGAGGNVAWSFNADLPLGAYAHWSGAAGAEVELADAFDIDAVSPTEDCLTYLPAGNDLRTLLACRDAAVIDLDTLSNPDLGSVQAKWVQGAPRFVAFGEAHVDVVQRVGTAWSVAPVGGYTDIQILGSSLGGDRQAFSATGVPVTLLSAAQAAPAASAPTVPPSFAPYQAAFSPDGQSALVWSNSALVVTRIGNPAGGAQIPIGVGTTVAGASWSPDGTHFLVALTSAGVGSVVVFDAVTYAEHPIAGTSVAAARWVSSSQLAILDDAQNLFVVAADGTFAGAAPVATDVTLLFGSIQIALL